MKLNPPDNATLINGDDLADLIPSLHTQEELNEFEQNNILLAERWAERGSGLEKDFPTMDSLKLLHRKMFDETWKWAGEFRKTNLNLGVDWHKVQTEVKNLCDNTHYWIKNTTYPWDELAARFHHQLVFVHPFKNGNGRHARLATNILLKRNGQKPFTWGSASIARKGNVREDYVTALKAADKGQISMLVTFAKS